MQLDFSLEHQVWDNVETVTVESVRAAGNIQAVISGVRRHAVTLKEQAASYGVYQAADVIFYVPRNMVPSDFWPLNPRDAVIDAQGVRYTALTAEGRKWDASGLPADYKLGCRNLAIAYDLADFIDVETPTRTLDATAAKTVTEWTPKYRLLPARVQLVSSEVTEVLGKREIVRKFEVFVDREVSVSSEDRVRWTRNRVQFPMNTVNDPSTNNDDWPPIGRSAILGVTGYRAAQSITDLPVIEVGTVT